MNLRRYGIQLGLFIVLIIVAVAAMTLPAGTARQIAVFCLVWILPAIGWMLLLSGYLSEKFLIAAGLVLVYTMLIALLVSYFPEVAPNGSMLLGVIICAALPLLISILRPDKDNKGGVRLLSTRILLALGAIILITLMLRLPNIGYKELQGDEGIIMVRAAAILTGDDAELFIHQKAPAEILVPLTTWSLAETIDELWLRLPFSWIGILAVIALFWLTRTWFSDLTGLAAALLFTVGGFAISFSRIAQYQSFVILFGILALLMAARYRKSNRNWDLYLSVIFLAAGLLAHYDAILFAPAVLWIVVGAFWQTRTGYRTWGIALLIGLILLGLFYVPYVLAPSFSKTLAYLIGGRVGVGDEQLKLGLGGMAAWQMSTFYNSIWYVLGLVILGVVGLIGLARSRTQFAAVLFFLVPASFYLLIVRDPRTHVYAIFPGAAVLAGLGASTTANWIWSKDNRILSAVAALVSLMWLILVTLYPYLLFVDVDLERQRTWEENRPIPVLYPVTWQEPPTYGLFGFPHQAGWRVARALVEEQDLPYASNEEEEVTNWYMTQADRTHCPDFRTFFLATNVQDAVPFDQERLKDLSLHSQITVNGQTTMKVFSQGPVESVNKIEAAGTDLWLRPEELVPRLPVSSTPVDVLVGEEIRLIGYEIDGEPFKAGDDVIVRLYWQSLAPVTRNRQVFVHLTDDDLVAQHDGAPECAYNPLTRWEPGQVVPDVHIVTLPEELSGGTLSVKVGMYDLLNGDRLEIPGSPDNSIHLTDVSIQE